MKTCVVKMFHDDDFWHCETEAEVGVMLHSGSFDALVERVKIAVPEMLEENLGYTGSVNIVFEVQYSYAVMGQSDGRLFEESKEVAI